MNRESDLPRKRPRRTVLGRARVESVYDPRVCPGEGRGIGLVGGERGWCETEPQETLKEVS